jgi:hypothetical protein
VAQLLGPGERSLLIGRPGNIRRWVAGNLGQGPPPKPGRRPKTDLSPVAEAVRWLEATSAFQQRLVYERLMLRHVPLAARRDLKHPAYLHLDPSERFPRIAVRASGSGENLFGPLRDRRSAERAARHVLERFPLRPCDYEFEPDPALALGLGCVFAQVRSCSAPCLARVPEEAYRALARDAAAFLAAPERRPEGAPVPDWVQAVDGCGLVAEPTARGVELYPVVAGGVVEDAAVVAPADALPAALEAMCWPAAPGRDDRPWLLAWLGAPRRRGGYVAAPRGAAPAALAGSVAELVGRASSATRG